MDGNQRFVRGQLQSIKEDLSILKAKTAEKQEPFAAILSCADSRVPVEFVFDQSIGQLFVVRVAGNIATPEIIASLEYGVAVLGTRVLMVLGHANCGAVKATIDGKAVPGQISALYAQTHIAPGDGYVDTVLIGHRFDGDATSTRGLGIELDGDGASASVEAGYPVRFTEAPAWLLEPQMQLVWQHVLFDEQRDRFAMIGFDSDDALIGRFGLRLARDVETSRGLLQPYLKANFWHGFGGDGTVSFNLNRVVTSQDYNAFEFGGGVVARFSPNVPLYLVGDYTVDLGDEGEDRASWEGGLGLRVDW